MNKIILKGRLTNNVSISYGNDDNLNINVSFIFIITVFKNCAMLNFKE